jgi:ElaB/YqjD/DUF883 family membrane-anchored ribosome-binding protein
MARKTAAQAAEDQIKDQAFSELQSLIEESEKLLKSSASLVGEEAETLRGQIALKLQQARDSVTSVRDRTLPAVEATETYIGGHPMANRGGFGRFRPGGRVVVGSPLTHSNTPNPCGSGLARDGGLSASTQMSTEIPSSRASPLPQSVSPPIPAGSPASAHPAQCHWFATWRADDDGDHPATA